MKFLYHWKKMKRFVARQQTKPMKGQYEAWHIKKPLMGRRKDAIQATTDSFYAKKGHRFETETEVASASHTPWPP